MKDFDIKTAQQLIYDEVTKVINTTLPKSISFTNELNEQTRNDLYKLLQESKISWDLNFKLQPFMDSITNYEHPITGVAYYGSDTDGYSCVGYFLGSVNEQKNAIELNYIEKRSDSHNDLDRRFFASTLKLIAAYAQFLNSKKITINTIALIAPVEGKTPLYQKYGFKLNKNYCEQNRPIMTLENASIKVKYQP